MKTYYKGYVINEHYEIRKNDAYITVVKNLHEAKYFIDKLN